MVRVVENTGNSREIPESVGNESTEYPDNVAKLLVTPDIKRCIVSLNILGFLMAFLLTFFILVLLVEFGMKPTLNEFIYASLALHFGILVFVNAFLIWVMFWNGKVIEFEFSEHGC